MQYGTKMSSSYPDAQTPTKGLRQILKSTFTRALITSTLASAVDFLTLVFLVEVLHVYYVIATAIGALFGAAANFASNRHWGFQTHTNDPTDHPVSAQAIKYTLVAVTSLVLNTWGVYLVTEHLGVKYALSKILVGLAVGWIWNYPLHRWLVFR